ncbi:MAG: hypothetical protein E7478_00650 [Ruminococcaceae bacterium]|nr:hypothetical protein [Oscillospiraceae bacterium]
MKIIIGIVLVMLLIGALILYLVLMLNAHEMIYCGDITNDDNGGAMVTRVYTTDFSANETLSEIVVAMNSTENDALTNEEITEILAEYQNIIYAPVFIVNSQQLDTSTFEVIGCVYNGIDDDGEPAQPDYLYDNLRLNAIVQNGEVLSVENIYPIEEDQEGKLIEREKMIAPIITDEKTNASFAFEGTDTFRMIFRGTAELPAKVTFVYTYDVVAENPLDFTNIENGALAITMTVGFDEDGLFLPEYELEKNVTVFETEDEKEKD